MIHLPLLKQQNEWHIEICTEIIIINLFIKLLINPNKIIFTKLFTFLNNFFKAPKSVISHSSNITVLLESFSIRKIHSGLLAFGSVNKDVKLTVKNK